MSIYFYLLHTDKLIYWSKDKNDIIYNTRAYTHQHVKLSIYSSARASVSHRT